MGIWMCNRRCQSRSLWDFLNQVLSCTSICWKESLLLNLLLQYLNLPHHSLPPLVSLHCIHLPSPLQVALDSLLQRMVLSSSISCNWKLPDGLDSQKILMMTTAIEITDFDSNLVTEIQDFEMESSWDSCFNRYLMRWLSSTSCKLFISANFLTPTWLSKQPSSENISLYEVRLRWRVSR